MTCFCHILLLRLYQALPVPQLAQVVPTPGVHRARFHQNRGVVAPTPDGFRFAAETFNVHRDKSLLVLQSPTVVRVIGKTEIPVTVLAELPRMQTDFLFASLFGLPSEGENNDIE